MRHPVLVALCLAGTVGLVACQRTSDAEVQRALKSVNVIDESNLSDIMLTVGDPDEAVAYFARASSENRLAMMVSGFFSPLRVFISSCTRFMKRWKCVRIFCSNGSAS